MKYCRVCKIRAKDSDVVCSRCGGELGTLGLGAAGGASDGASGASEPSLVIQGQIRELQQAQRLNVRRGRQLALACVIVLGCLLLVAYEVYAQTVLSYAVLENVRIEQDPTMDNRIHVKFDVVKPGRVAFDRRSGVNHTEKLDVYDRPGPVQFSWAWPSDAQTGIDFGVIYRGGLTRTFERKHFEVGKPAGKIAGNRSHSLSRLIAVMQAGDFEFMRTWVGSPLRACMNLATLEERST
jgi:hypothetical protein